MPRYFMIIMVFVAQLIWCSGWANRGFAQTHDSRKDLESFQPLFNGRDLSGWEGDLSLWKVENGCIVGDSPGIKRNQFLATTSQFEDFELRLQFRLRDGVGNSGIQFRSQRVPNETEVSGYQADIGEKYWGCLYDESRRKKVLVQAAAELQSVLKPSDWNEYVVRAEGNRITLTMNGIKTVDYGEPDATIPRHGLIALQVHSGPALKIEFRNILIKRLPSRRPNVVFMLTDDQRWDCLGCMGHPHLKTPHIDRLAAEGILFQNAFCTTSLCSPSRASILSGLYAHSHGVTNNFTEYPVELPSMPRQLQSYGYQTAYLGKWHMGENNDEKRPGFDYFVTHKGQGKYFDTEFNKDGVSTVVPGYYTHVVTDMSLDWLKQRDSSRPFFLMIGQKAPHSFYVPEPAFADAFAAVDITYPESAFQLGDKPEWFQKRLNTWHGIYGPLFDFRKDFPNRDPAAVKDFAAMTRAYWATILSVDQSVGKICNYLKEAGIFDETIFVFAGDNGLLNGEHGMVDKRTMHEPSIRVPLVVRFPGLTPAARPKVIREQVLHVDLAPSLLDLCGVPALRKTHGKSWKKLISEGDSAWRKSWHYEYNYEAQFPYTPNIRGVRTDDWKLIRYPHGDGSPDKHLSELYRISDDPLESRNLIRDPQYQMVVQALQTELDRLIRETDGLPDQMPVDGGILDRLPESKIR